MRTTALLLAHAAALAFGTYHTFKPTFDSRFARTQTENGDGMLNHLILENSWLALTKPDYCGTLATPPFYYPATWTLAYSENLLGSAPIYWGLRAVTDHELAYIWWQIICCALNFVAFAVVARWLKLNPVLAVFGAFLWGFAVVHADQIKHQQMIPRFFMPFAAYYAIRLSLEPSAKYLNGLLGAVFLQCFACVYTGWFLAVGVATFLPLALALRPGAGRELWAYARAHKRRVAGVVGLWGGAMLLLFLPYIAVNFGIERKYEECFDNFPTPAAWFTGPKGSRWYDTLDVVRKPAPFECLLFCGFGLYGLLLAAAVHLPLMPRAARFPLWPVAVAALVTALVWVLLTLAGSQRGESLWLVTRRIPGGNAIRVVSRVYVIVTLFGWLGMLLWLSAILERLKRPAVGFAVLVPVIAFVVWEQTGFEQMSFERAHFYPLVDRNAARLRGAEVGYVEPAYTDPAGQKHQGAYGEVFGMWVGMRANVPVLNGYSGRGPTDFPLVGSLSRDDIRVWLDGKFRGTVRHIHPDSNNEWFIVVE